MHCRKVILPLIFAVQAAAFEQQVISPQYGLKSLGQPFKLSIRPTRRTVSAGQGVQLIVTLLDAGGKPVKASKEVQLRIRVTDPSGQSHDSSTRIDQGRDSDTQSFMPSSTGKYLLEVKDVASILYSDKYSFYVLPAPGKKSKLIQRPSHLAFAAKPEHESLAPFQDPAPSGKLLLGVRARDEGVLADGQDYATVSATFLSSDGKGATKNGVQVWFRRSNGDLNTRPLVIPANEKEGQVLWTSKWPVDATIDFVSSYPQYDVEGTRSFTVRFVRPVDGIVPIGPSSFSLVEKPTLTVYFVDYQGFNVSTDVKRSVVFSVKKTGVAPSPAEAVVSPGGLEASTTLLPISTGESVIQIDSQGLRNGSYTYMVKVTIGVLVALSLLGGLIGGGISFLRKRTLPALRLIGGIAGGFVLSAIYVFGVFLPLLKLQLASNTITVVAVSLLGGYAGTEVLDWAWGRMKQ
jgi:hypothetical protein